MESESNQFYNNMEMSTESKFESVDFDNSGNSAARQTVGAQSIEPLAVDPGTSKTDTEASKTTNLSEDLLRLLKKTLTKRPYGWQKKWIARLIDEGMSPQDAIDFASDKANWPPKPEKPPSDPKSEQGGDCERPATESQPEQVGGNKKKRKKIKEKAKIKRLREESASLQIKTMDVDQNPILPLPQREDEESSSESSSEQGNGPESQPKRVGCSKNKKKKIREKARMKRRLEEAKSLLGTANKARGQDDSWLRPSLLEKCAPQLQPELVGENKKRLKKIKDKAKIRWLLEEARSLQEKTGHTSLQLPQPNNSDPSQEVGQQIRNSSTSKPASSDTDQPYSIKSRTKKPYVALVPVKGGFKPKLRNHLSGAQKLKLKYWLSQGLPYDDAVAKAKDPINKQRSVSLESSVPGSKPPRPYLVYIVPHGYPVICLSEEQLAAIENSLLEAIFNMDGKLEKPCFKDSCRKDGRYMMTCKNEFSKKWLSEFLKEYQPWPDVHLEVLSDLKKTKARAVLPLCIDDDDLKLLTFIGKQNHLLKVGVWDVLNREDTDSNTFMDLDIDVESARMLMECSTISFKLGSAAIILCQADVQCQTPRALLATRNKYGLATHIMNPPDFPHLNDSYEAAFPSPTTRSISTQTTAPLKAHLSLAGPFQNDDSSLPGVYYVEKAVAKKSVPKGKKSKRRKQNLKQNSGYDKQQSSGSYSGWVGRPKQGSIGKSSPRSFNSSSIFGSGGPSGTRWRSDFPPTVRYFDRSEPLPRGVFLRRPWDPPQGYQRPSYPPPQDRWNDYHSTY